MKALKFLVLSMGVVLIVGFGFLIWGLSTKGGSSAPSHAPKIASDTSRDLGQVTVPLPVGAKVEQILTVDNRLIVRTTGNGPDHLLVIEPNSGHLAGDIVLAPPQQ